MRLGEIAGLPAVLTAQEIADLCSVGVDHVYAEVRAGRWPTPVLRIGRAVRFPTMPALEALGLGGDIAVIDQPEAAEPEAPTAPRGVHTPKVPARESSPPQHGERSNNVHELAGKTKRKTS